ncbi:hypothetical protein FJZ19_01415 [Candidatus Pacearchaeota archaeon]|nr:hypothetical protein [Candidatus Pacearchaeota archaeon]
MRFMRKALGIGALVLALAGCDNQPRNYNAYVDLNNDKKQEVVAGNYGESHWDFADYDTFVAKNDGNGNFGEPELINRQKK